MGKQVYEESVEEIYKRLDTSLDGLTSEEARIRIEKNGENKLSEAKKKSNLKLFIEQFNDLMIILLVIASLLSLVISFVKNESCIDSIIIIVIVIINAILSFIQEKKASEAIEELNKMFATETYVIRDGMKVLVDVKDIVVGDIIELEAGDYVSADGRVITSNNLALNESTLTGESISIEKNSNTLKGKKELYERENMVFAGCNVTNGHGFIVVTQTATDTELGKIASSLINKKPELTPLQKKVNGISKVLTYIILGIIVLMMLVGLVKENDFFDILMLSISLAVAAIPEGMSSVITIILSIGMSKMAKRNVIIRKMSSVETLGVADVICSDKTGTITQNKMVVKNIFVNGKLYTEEEDITDFELLGMCSSLCHNVSKNKDKYIGDETEVAIYKYLENKEFYVDNFKRLDEYPFDSDRKMMSTINNVDGELYAFTKGSLDSILNHSASYLENGKIHKITDKYKEEIFKMEKELSDKSLRLLAFAYKKDDIDDMEENMIFIGLIGMMDPPRENVRESIEKCIKAGIRPIMITGDSINTARAIARDVKIIDDPKRAIEGKYIDDMSEEELAEAVNYYSVYARISPNTKLKIVHALQKQGLIVAMSGDGVNDAPALEKADIGIGMGITGTDVVKKVADCILVDDSFTSIVDGVEEGRKITSNIKKVMLYLLAGNIVEVILVFVCMLAGIEIFSALQLLWINLLTDSIPAIMLAFEEAEEGIMSDDPCNKAQKTFFTPFLSAKIIVESLIKSVIMLSWFSYFMKVYDVTTASSLMFIFLILNELLYAFSCRSLKHSVINKRIFSNVRLTLGVGVLLIMQIALFETELGKYFIPGMLSIGNITKTLSLCVFTFLAGEMLKPMLAKKFKDYVE